MKLLKSGVYFPGLASFQVLSSHTLLVATILDSTDVDIKNVQRHSY